MRKNTRITGESKIIGHNLKILRESAGFSQYEVAGILNVSYQQIQKYETGQNRLPIEKLFRLRRFYEVSYEIFFHGLPDKPETGVKKFSGDWGPIYARIAAAKDKALRQKIERIILILLE